MDTNCDSGTPIVCTKPVHFSLEPGRTGRRGRLSLRGGFNFFSRELRIVFHSPRRSLC